MAADDWKTNAQGVLEYDEKLTKENASTQLKKGETYVAKSFLGEDQKGQVFEFQDDGQIRYEKGATTSMYISGGYDGEFKSVVSTELGKKSDANISKASAGVLSPVTSAPPLKLVAAAVGVYYLIKAAVNIGSSDDMQFSFSLPESIKTSGFFDSMGQRGNNNGKLEPQELEKLTNKRANGDITKSEFQKLKKHEKNTGQKHSRQSKDKKK